MRIYHSADLNHLLFTLREKESLWFALRVAGRLLNPVHSRIRRTMGFLKWMYPRLGGVLAPLRSSERRVLVVYDLSCQPFSIGDILVNQEASLVLREKYGLGMVDFALVYDPKQPAPPDPAFARITESNVLYHLASVLPVAQVNQHLGSLFVFDSHSRLIRFISDNDDLYHVWPPASLYAKREYLYYTVFNDLLYNYYQEQRTIPYLSCRQPMIDWAQEFYRKHARSQVPVTVQLRNNRVFGAHRNLRLESWLDFFRHCEGRYPVKFFVVCGLAEIDDRLRHCPNVIVVKDHDTGIEQDLALIQTAAIHMGASSGPGTVAVFGAKPYLLVNTDLIPKLYRGVLAEGRFLRFCFAGPLQRLAVGPESTELLIEEFARMWEAVDLNSWRSPATAAEKGPSADITWLR